MRPDIALTTADVWATFRAGSCACADCGAAPIVAAMRSLLLAMVVSTALSLHAADTPNVLVILCDDLGYGDPRCYNAQSKIPTPHIDRLAAEGVRFTDAHTPSSVCTPTRYSLLTGRYCWRTGIKRGVLDGFDAPLIGPGRATLASFLKGQGYGTACIGKWHLGLTWFDHEGKPLPSRPLAVIQGHRGGEDADFSRELRGGPVDQGFDSWFGISASLDMSPYAFIQDRKLTATPTEKMAGVKELAMSVSEGVRAPGFQLEGVLPEFTRRAVAYLEARAGKKEPFFLYLPLTSPHLPVVPSAAWRGKTGAGDYADFTAETDATVGACLDALDRAGVARDTLVVFTTDNGGLWHQWDAKEPDDVAGYEPTPRAKYNAERGHRSNAGLRGTKADVWEGGHRVPFIVRWPARVNPAVSDALVELNDLFATLAEAIGTPLPADAAEDSFSFLPVLTGDPATGPRRTFSVHHSLQGVFALREGPWKYVPSRGSGGFSVPKSVKAKAGEPAAQLYRMTPDFSESQNVAGDEPATVERLARRLREIQESPRTRP
jgi:arylsulfatase A